jgi:tRNA(Ile)-lysidine synthase
MGQLLGPDFPSDIALAVSGGGDSMAMLSLAHNWTRVWGVRLWVVTIDHGLRPEAAAEAAMVSQECAALGWPHAILRWHWDHKGNVMESARDARLDLIDRWRGDIRHVLMAHTRDDLAETLLMRLLRGAGVEGLAAMAERQTVRPKGTAPGDMTGATPPAAHKGSEGFELIRPCLGLRRAELRHYLTAIKGRWADDPTNDDPSYDRARMRALIRQEGLDVDILARTAQTMRRARDALRARSAEVWQKIGHEDRRTGSLTLNRAGFEVIERDTQMRLLAKGAQWVASARHRPRGPALETALDRLLGGGDCTLHGCELRMERDHLQVFREFGAVSDLTLPLREGIVWDGRWRVTAPTLLGPETEVRPLGEAGWLQANPKPDNAPRHRLARGLPAIWAEGRLLACDALSIGPGDTVQLLPSVGDVKGFREFLLSH